MIGVEDAHSTYEYDGYYKILPVINDWSEDEARIKNGTKVPDGFLYDSETNSEWMSKDVLKAWLTENKNRLGKI